MDAGTINVKPRDQHVLSWLAEDDGEVTVPQFVMQMDAEIKQGLGIHKG